MFDRVPKALDDTVWQRRPRGSMRAARPIVSPDTPTRQGVKAGQVPAAIGPLARCRKNLEERNWCIRRRKRQVAIMALRLAGWLGIAAGEKDQPQSE